MCKLFRCLISKCSPAGQRNLESIAKWQIEKSFAHLKYTHIKIIFYYVIRRVLPTKFGDRILKVAGRSRRYSSIA